MDDEAKARIAELEAALAPFATVGSPIEGDSYYTDDIMTVRRRLHVSSEHYVAAWTVLNQQEKR